MDAIPRPRRYGIPPETSHNVIVHVMFVLAEMHQHTIEMVQMLMEIIWRNATQSLVTVNDRANDNHRDIVLVDEFTCQRHCPGGDRQPISGRCPRRQVIRSNIQNSKMGLCLSYGINGQGKVGVSDTSPPSDQRGALQRWCHWRGVPRPPRWLTGGRHSYVQSGRPSRSQNYVRSRYHDA